MTRNKSILMRLFTVLVICTMLFTAATAPIQVLATSQSDLESQLQSLQKQKEQIDKELKNTKGSISNEQKYQTQLNAKIKNIQQQISLLSQRIGNLNDQIAQKQADIDATQVKIDSNHDLLKQRLRAMYMNDSATVLSVLLGSSTFAEYMSMAEMISSVTNHDDQLIKELIDQMNQIAADKATIELSKTQAESDKSSLDSKNNELNASMAESKDELNDLKADEAKLNKSYQQVVNEMAQADAELQAYIRAHQGNGQLSPGGWLWPVSGYTRISSYYGNRVMNGVTEFHKGLDIPCAKGTPIRASKSGTVIDARYSSSYGNLVVIDHGGQYSTAYAHNSSLLVSVGQYVTQGQTIALAGSTGNSTGNHCHFEVRINGVAQNPLLYVSQP